MSQKSKLNQKGDPKKGLPTFQLGVKSQPESKVGESEPGSSGSNLDKGVEQKPASGNQTALARLAAMARAGEEGDGGNKTGGEPNADPSPQAIIDDPDYTSTFNILSSLKGRSAKGDFSNLEIRSSGVDLSGISDRIFNTAWGHAKKAVKSPSKSVRVKKLLAALDDGDPTKSVIPSVSIIPDEPACNFIYQSASAPHIDAFASEISDPISNSGNGSTSTSTNSK